MAGASTLEIERMIQVLSEMLADRGDDIAEFVESADAVPRTQYFSEMIVLNTDLTVVIFALKKDFAKSFIKECVKAECETAADFVAVAEKIGGVEGPVGLPRTIRNFILVLADAPSTQVANTLADWDKKLGASSGMLQVFLKKELMYNPSRHEFVPKHEKMSAEEVEALRATYRIKSKQQLPQIHRTDVMARWLGLRHGDIVRITRYNTTSGEYHYYRHCA